MSRYNYGSTYTTASDGATGQDAGYYYSNPNRTYRAGTSTYKPPAELLDSDNEAEAEGGAYDDEDEEVAEARSSTAQQTASRPGAYYEEEDPPIQIVQLDQGTGGQLDSVQRERHHEEVVSDDDGEGYAEEVGEQEEEEEEQDVEEEGSHRFVQRFTS